MNPIVTSTIIAAASFILTIFSALYLNQQHVNKLMESFRNEVGAKIDGLEKRMDARFEAMNDRFDHLEARLSERIDSLDKRIDRIERQFDTMFKLPK